MPKRDATETQARTPAVRRIERIPLPPRLEQPRSTMPYQSFRGG